MKEKKKVRLYYFKNKKNNCLKKKLIKNSKIALKAQHLPNFLRNNNYKMKNLIIYTKDILIVLNYFDAIAVK